MEAVYTLEMGGHKMNHMHTLQPQHAEQRQPCRKWPPSVPFHTQEPTLAEATPRGSQDRMAEPRVTQRPEGLADLNPLNSVVTRGTEKMMRKKTVTF